MHLKCPENTSATPGNDGQKLLTNQQGLLSLELA